MAENDESVNAIVSETTMDVTDQKCPCCGATIQYDPASRKMACAYCGYEREIPAAESEAVIEEIDFESAKIRQSKDWGKPTKSVVCKQCGGETIYDSAETAAACPFCGSNNVMPVDNDEEVMAPGGVVPFEISQEKAAQLFKSWLGGKLFAPNAAKKACVAKDFNGLYLPYWTYDSDTTSSYVAKLGFDKRVKRGDSYVTETTWRTYTGVYQEFIDDQLIYASKKTTSPYIKSVSNFDFTKLRPYSPEFVAGFAAERYTLGLDDGWTEAKKEINTTLKSHLGSKLKSQHRADRVGTINLSTSYDNITFKYLLAPIWLSAFKFNGKVYQFVVNGQTGKIAGKSPVSPWKVAIAIALVLLAIIIFYSLSN